MTSDRERAEKAESLINCVEGRLGYVIAAEPKRLLIAAIAASHATIRREALLAAAKAEVDLDMIKQALQRIPQYGDLLQKQLGHPAGADMERIAGLLINYRNLIDGAKS